MSDGNSEECQIEWQYGHQIQGSVGGDHPSKVMCFMMMTKYDEILLNDQWLFQEHTHTYIIKKKVINIYI